MMILRGSHLIFADKMDKSMQQYMRIGFLIGCLSLLPLAIRAQDSTKTANQPPTAPPILQKGLVSEYRPLFWGLEQDPLPYCLKGFYLSAWAGLGKIRLRGVLTHTQTPHFLIRPNIASEHTKAGVLWADFATKEHFKGFWLGIGGGFWAQELKSHPNGLKRVLDSAVFGIGAGYNWFVFKGLYISPFVSLHIRLSGNKAFILDGLSYEPRSIMPVLSLRLGYRFGR
jgi:hypothetical protein